MDLLGMTAVELGRKIKEKEVLEHTKKDDEIKDTSDELIDKKKKSIKTKTLSMRELVRGQKVIKDENDIDEIIETLKRRLKEELEEDTIINLI